MNHVPATEAIKRALGFPFRDPRWQNKFLIGSLLFFGNFIIPILPTIFMLGYAAQIVRRMVEGDGEMHLPEWSDPGKLFTDGFRLFAANLIYSLPFILLFTTGMLAMFVPLVFMPLADHGSTEGIFVILMMLGQLVFFVLFGIAMFFAVIYYIISPAMLVHTAAREKLSAAFEIGKWFHIFKANFWGFFAAVIVMAGIYTALMYLTQIIYMTFICCWLLPFLMAPIVFYMMVTSFALFAEAYKIGREPVVPTPAAE